MITVNGERCRVVILVDYLALQLEEIDLDDLFFDEDDNTSYISGETINLLLEKFSQTFNFC